MSDSRIFYIADQAGTRDFSRQPLHYAMRGNLKPGRFLQQDCMGFVDITGISPAIYRLAISSTIGQAKRAVLAHPSHYTSSSTMSLLLYDPETFTLELGQVGNSPCFLLVDSPKGKAYLELTDHVDVNDKILVGIAESGVNILNAADRTQPMRMRERGGNLNLTRVAMRLTSKIGCTREELKLSLLVTSDGAIGLTANEKTQQAELLAMPDSNDGNRMERWLTRLETEQLADDNLSAILLPDIHLGKGEPIGLIMCDGQNTLGHEVAAVAAKAAADNLDKLRQQASSRAS